MKILSIFAVIMGVIVLTDNAVAGSKRQPIDGRKAAKKFPAEVTCSLEVANSVTNPIPVGKSEFVILAKNPGEVHQAKQVCQTSTKNFSDADDVARYVCALADWPMNASFSNVRKIVTRYNNGNSETERRTGYNQYGYSGCYYNNSGKLTVGGTDSNHGVRTLRWSGMGAKDIYLSFNDGANRTKLSIYVNGRFHSHIPDTNSNQLIHLEGNSSEGIKEINFEAWNGSVTISYSGLIFR